MEAIYNLWVELANYNKAILILVGTLCLHIFLKKIVLKKLEALSAKTSNDLDDRFVHFADQFLWLIMCFIATLGILKVFNIEIGPLLAGAGIAGIAIGMAAKETMADVLAGVSLIADRPIKIGDRINFDAIGGGHWGGWGDVVDIGLRRTTIRNSDGVFVNYPNNLLSNSVITNFSHETSSIRVRLRFQVDYTADINKVRELTLKVIAENPRIMPDTGALIVRSIWDDKQGLYSSGVMLEARYRIENVRKRTDIRAEVLERLLEELKANEIPMPTFPNKNI